jgi:hypothetical protein
MNFTMTKIAAAAVLATAAMSAQAAPVAFDNDGAANFTMYDSTGGLTGSFNDITGFVDFDNMTFGVDGSTAFFGAQWTASGGTLFGAGTHTVNVNGDGADAPAGSENVTFTVGANQMGGNINFAWGPTAGIDVFMVWDLVPTTPGHASWVSSDVEGDGILGRKMVDGPFQGFSANFNFQAAAVPEASTYGMMLAGLGLVGFAVRRRKLMA